jgi:hypothetical protein
VPLDLIGIGHGGDLRSASRMWARPKLASPRLVHHGEVIALTGDSHRLKDPDLGRVPAASTTEG